MTRARQVLTVLTLTLSTSAIRVRDSPLLKLKTSTGKSGRSSLVRSSTAMPLISGKGDVEKHEMPVLRSDRFEGLGAGACFAGSFNVRRRAEEVPETTPDDGMVIEDRNSGRIHNAETSHSRGIRRRTAVPSPGVQASSNCPPRYWARSRMPTTPKERFLRSLVLSKPRPLSCISSTR